MCIFCDKLISFHRDHAFFVDLFVRTDNKLAVSLYEKLKYSVYRHILEYYGNKTDAFGNLCFKKINDIDMRKALSRDKEKTTIIPAYDKPIHVSKIYTTLYFCFL